MISKFEALYREKTAKEDCLACRVVTGLGMIGIGAFILSHSKRPRVVESYAMKSLAAVAAVLGVARLADASFLKAEKDSKR